MSQKKYKKRHSQSTMSAKRQAAEEKLADQKDRDRKRMNPTARSLLLGDLVFLAVCEILYRKELISDLVSGLTTIVGVILLMLALWFQFGKKRKNGGASGGRSL